MPATMMLRHKLAAPPKVMGIVNTTPDSFSDGGKYLDPASAAKRIAQILDDGADCIDIGGESTRPGAPRVAEDVELARVIPVISYAAQHYSVPVSVDTTRAAVARQALQAGATIVNDVSGGFADPDILTPVADAGAQYIIGHWRRYMPRQLRLNRPDLDVGAVIDELRFAVDHAVHRGVSPVRSSSIPASDSARTQH